MSILILAVLGCVLAVALLLLTQLNKCKVCEAGTMKRVCDHPVKGDLYECYICHYSEWRKRA